MLRTMKHYLSNVQQDTHRVATYFTFYNHNNCCCYIGSLFQFIKTENVIYFNLVLETESIEKYSAL